MPRLISQPVFVNAPTQPLMSKHCKQWQRNYDDISVPSSRMITRNKKNYIKITMTVTEVHVCINHLRVSKR